MLDTSHRYVLLDRDGVINRHIVNGYVARWQDFAFLPGVLAALRLLRENGYTVLVVSNQSCVGRGLLSWQELQAITRRMLLEVALAGGAIDKVYYCPHAPGAGCSCRKPQPGLLLKAMEEHQAWPAQIYMVGDSESDMEAAARAGCRGLLVQRGAFLQDGAGGGTFTNVVSDLLEAANLIVRRDTSTLDETLRCALPHLHSAWHAVSQIPTPSKKEPGMAPTSATLLTTPTPAQPELVGQLGLHKSQLGDLQITLGQIRVMLLARQGSLEAGLAQLSAVSQWMRAFRQTL
jgi:D-glycero-D-manno-heptose 1,7-bisphosphate phosphatase